MSSEFFIVEIGYQGDMGPRNVVDKEIQSMLYPLHLMQLMVLNPKYRMENNCIKPNTCFNKCILTCGLIMFLTGYLYRFIEILVDDNFKRYGTIEFLYFASYYDFVFYSTGFIMNIVLHCIHSNNIVTFVLTFQDIHRFLNNNNALKWSVLRNWIYVVTLFGLYFVFLFFMPATYNQPSWYAVLNLIFLTSLDVNIVYVMSLIKLLEDKVRLWNDRVQRSRRNVNDKMECDRMYEAYVNILKCYEICKNLFQQPVLYQTIETFSRCLINFQVMIEFRRLVFVKAPLVSVFLYFWVVKTLVLQLALSLQAEKFYEAVKLAQNSCSSILSSNCNDDQKKLCKNILRMHRASYSKMSACGLFYVDICQPLRLMALLTNYTVVLLQFAFL